MPLIFDSWFFSLEVVGLENIDLTRRMGFESWGSSKQLEETSS